MKKNWIRRIGISDDALWTRRIDDVAETILHADGKCVFLIGAGCSVSAGIPLASQLIEQVKHKFPRAYEYAQDKKNYNKVMSTLTPNQRTDLLNQYIKSAKVNWAHLALAQLFHENKIDRILTVNFDPLIVRACAMAGSYPAIYDLAIASKFKSNRIAEKSVFYLNGQHTGFITLNADGELESHRTRLKQIVEDTGFKRTWVIIGYSGEADPLLDVLAENESFDGGLYWVGFEERPSETLLKKLFSRREKQAYWVGKQDSDQFLKELAQNLNCFPPTLLTHPFDHVAHIVSDINFQTGGHTGGVLEGLLSKQIEHSRNSFFPIAIKNPQIEFFLSGKHKEIVNWYEKIKNPSEQLNEQEQENIAWAYLKCGDSLDDEAYEIQEQDPETAMSKSLEALEKYQIAVSLFPNSHIILYNYGLCLQGLADRLTLSNRQEALHRWRLAGSIFEKASEIKPNDLDTYIYWGYSLSSEANLTYLTSMLDAIKAWNSAAEKFKAALTISPQNYLTFYYWACSLIDEATAMSFSGNNDAFERWNLATEKCKQLLELSPNSYSSHVLYGNALSHKAKLLATIDTHKALEGWTEAKSNFNKSLLINPDGFEALTNLGDALANEAQYIFHQNTEKALELLNSACDMHERAHNYKKTESSVLLNWGEALIIKQRFSKNSNEKRELLLSAKDKLTSAHMMGNENALYDFSCISAIQGDVENCIYWLNKSLNAKCLPTFKHISNDPDLESVRLDQKFSDWIEQAFPANELAVQSNVNGK